MKMLAGAKAFYRNPLGLLDVGKHKMMKKILKGIGILILLIIIIIVLFIFNTSSQYKKMSQGQLISEITLDTIPFTYSSSGHILISTKINKSKKEYQFILDSGAANFIFKKFQKDENLENNGYAIGRNSSGSIFFTNIKKINYLQIQNLKFVNLNAKETEFNFDCMEDVYGIIGAGLMHNLIWSIDFKNQVIIVSKNLNEFKFQNNKIEIPLSENKFSHHISTSVKFRKSKKSASVLVDLGNSGTLNLKENNSFKDSLKFKSNQIFGIGNIGLEDDMNRKSEERFQLLDSVIFGNTSYFINNIPTITNPKGLNLLGLGFFKKYRTTISWIDKKLILEPYDSIQNFSIKSYGFTTKHDNEKNIIYIKSITENSPAFKAKLPLNAEILSINDKDFSNFGEYCEYKTTYNSNDKIKITIKENDSIKEYTLKKELIFND